MLVAFAKAGWVTETAALESPSVKAHRSRHTGALTVAGRGAKTQAIGPLRASRRGQTTKVHLLRPSWAC